MSIPCLRTAWILKWFFWRARYGQTVQAYRGGGGGTDSLHGGTVYHTQYTDTSPDLHNMLSPL
ncbi:hypothetical protein J6590_014723 [Homalodisca vitripennis]|nr:hypothetical protein J6590_014723 [Homalodisca vitripennis]